MVFFRGSSLPVTDSTISLPTIKRLLRETIDDYIRASRAYNFHGFPFREFILI